MANKPSSRPKPMPRKSGINPKGRPYGKGGRKKSK